jgi:hypothetical protein
LFFCHLQEDESPTGVRFPYSGELPKAHVEGDLQDLRVTCLDDGKHAEIVPLLKGYLKCLMQQSPVESPGRVDTEVHTAGRPLEVVVAERRHDPTIDFTGYAVEGPRKRKA